MRFQTVSILTAAVDWSNILSTNEIAHSAVIELGGWRRANDFKLVATRLVEDVYFTRNHGWLDLFHDFFGGNCRYHLNFLIQYRLLGDYLTDAYWFKYVLVNIPIFAWLWSRELRRQVLVFLCQPILDLAWFCRCEYWGGGCRRRVIVRIFCRNGSLSCVLATRAR